MNENVPVHTKKYLYYVHFEVLFVFSSCGGLRPIGPPSPLPWVANAVTKPVPIIGFV